jgi:hypothetical protein
MPRLIGEHYDANGIRESWWDMGDGNVTVERSQDAQGAVDLVAAVNSNGGAKTLDGLGRPILEVPVVEAMAWAERRGIPWEKLLHSNEYDDEFKRFALEYSKLAYAPAKTVHAVQ